MGVIFGFLFVCMLRFSLNRQRPINTCILGVVEAHIRILLPCLFQIFSPFTLLSAAFHSRQTTRVPQTKKRRRCNALIHNAICLKAFSLEPSLQMNFSEQPQQHHQMEAVFSVCWQQVPVLAISMGWKQTGMTRPWGSKPGSQFPTSAWQGWYSEELHLIQGRV